MRHHACLCVMCIGILSRYVIMVRMRTFDTMLAMVGPCIHTWAVCGEVLHIYPAQIKQGPKAM